MTDEELKEQARRYAKVVQWSEKDQCFIGRCPDFPDEVRGTDEAEVYRELCQKVEILVEAIAIGLPPDPHSPTFVPDLEVVERQATEAIRGLLTQTLDNSSSDTRSGSAARSLYRLTYRAVEALGRVAVERAKVLHPIAERKIEWPAFISEHPDFKKNNVELIKELHLNKSRAPYKFQSRNKTWSFGTPKIRLARRVNNALHVQRLALRKAPSPRGDKTTAKLPAADGLKSPASGNLSESLTQRIRKLDDLSSGTWEEWAETGWKFLCETSPQNKPELHPWVLETMTPTGKVRKTRSEVCFNNKPDAPDRVERKCPSIGRADLKESLFDGIETSTTGVSPRTRQRKKATRQSPD